MKKKANSRQQNLGAFAVGVLLAVSLFYVVKNPEIFQANILSIQDREILEQNKWDIGYKTQDGALDVYVSEGLVGPESLILEVLYENERVDFDFSIIDHQGSFSVLHHEPGIYRIQVTDIDTLDVDESLLVLPFVGDGRQVLLGEVISQNSGSQEGLKIGRLDTDIQVHSN